MHLAGEHHHRIALARALCVPEHAQLAQPCLAVAYRVDRAVDAEKLVVPGDDLFRLADALIEQNEILHQVEKIALVAHALEQRLHVHRPRRLLGQTLPFVEVFPAAGDRTDLRLLAVAEHHNRVVVKQVRNGVAVIGEVLLESGLEILVDVLALDEQQRQAVDEADDVRPPPVQIATHPQLAHAEKIIVLRRIEIKHPQPLPHPLALVVAEGDLHAVAHLRVLLAVGRDQGLRCDRSR